MAETLKVYYKDKVQRLAAALDMVRCYSDTIALTDKLERSKITWLAARPTSHLGRCFPPTACPSDYLALACDGSHIDSDRHSPARCYLINIGSVVLRYGENPDAIMHSQPLLYANEDDLTITDPEGSTEQPVQGNILGIKRSISESLALVNMATEHATQLPTIALLDGSLILWGLTGKQYPDYVKLTMLQNGLLPVLDRFKEISNNSELVIASYISTPQSTEVVNLLRLVLCPHDSPNCDLHCPRNDGLSYRACQVLSGIRDRDIFSAILNPGERSATFISRSSIVLDSYEEHQICFFYLQTEEEVARVEFPVWIEERGRTDLLHSLILDQCRRGHSYPIALSESHEQAVVSTVDREQFRQLVETTLEEQNVVVTTSSKSKSKRTRWI